ncbi:MAG: ComF family protein [Armatimonadota bacterium]
MKSSGISSENSRRFLRDIWDGALDLIYPPKCLVCGEMQQKYFCDECLAGIAWIEPPVCSFCGKPIDEKPCLECNEMDFAFDSARSVAAYDGTLKEAIHKFKYSGQRVLGPVLAALVVDHLRRRDQIRRVGCIIPVPIHPTRLRYRGFNQSEILAEEIGRAFGLPVLVQVLNRTRPTRPQVNLRIDERHGNVEGAFEVGPGSARRISGMKVLLVDDVYTTGSTSDAAARALKDAGAAEVHVLTLARSL